MQVWHLTDDAPREPGRVTPGSPVRLRVGTWPIEPAQEVAVEFSVTSRDGAVAGGRAPGRWVENRGANAYWTATLGPFADGDRVAYRAVGSAHEAATSTAWASFTVRPAIHVALLWHQHQPLYRDSSARSSGAFSFPWVRLHALRDYFGMAHVAAQHPGVHLTINFSPVLLAQLEDYVRGEAADLALALTRKATERLTRAEARLILETFFDAHWHHQIYPHPRYRALLEQRVRGGRFSARDLTDLRMWATLAWFATEFRTGEVPLPDGGCASVRRFVEQGEGFTERDVEAMLTEQDRILRSVVPLHRRLQDTGQIEVSVSPYFHPILPLLIDTDRATVDRPGASLPPRFAHPEDAEAQVAAAVAFYRERFGRPPRGLWPAEGAVAEPMLPILVRHGIRWVATDEGVLARSGRYGYRVDDPNVLCQPYVVPDPSGEGVVSVLFRHRGLSDAIGFHYHGVTDPDEAARDFVGRLKALAAGLRGERDFLVPVVLDGENAWGSYPEDGRPFLHALYGALAADPQIMTVTVSEYLDGSAERRVPSHPASEQPRVYALFTGSWIDEYESAPGADLGTWVGEPEENKAWARLGAVRQAVQAAGASPASQPEAFEALYAAEGSDWFWWFGEDHQSDADEAFDDLFRGHLAAACRLASVAPPSGLDDHIVPHRVVWTFTAPVGEIQAGDRLLVRTNCPGTLVWSADGWSSRVESPLAASGGVMAGPSRYAVTLPPLPAGGTLAFRFRCEHPGCARLDACCRGEERVVRVVGTSAPDRKVPVP